ncbi:AI-2E family transporter [Candidatus Woesearchaeota archaeon]|nr:AI-2E family transporter [Candidatus Woesearchaeota archaeon]
MLFGLGIILLFMAYLILRPFFVAILGSFILAYAFHPVYKLARKYLKSRRLSAVIVIILILIFIILPLTLILNSLLREVILNKITIEQFISTVDILKGECVDDNFICNVQEFLSQYIDETQLKFHISNIIDNIAKAILEQGGNFIFALPLYVMNFFIMIFIIFFLFIQGGEFVERIKKFLPIKKKYKDKLFTKMGDVTYAVIYGHVLVAGIQGLLGGIAFWIFGINSPVLWGLVIFFFALIPFIGTPVVWVPAGLIKLFGGSIGQAVGLFISGLFISTVDNFLKPAIISGSSDVHPVLVLLGVIGGLLAFGIFGIIIGPVLLSLVVRFVEIYEEEKSEAAS